MPPGVPSPLPSSHCGSAGIAPALPLAPARGQGTLRSQNSGPAVAFPWLGPSSQVMGQKPRGCTHPKSPLPFLDSALNVPELPSQWPQRTYRGCSKPSPQSTVLQVSCAAPPRPQAAKGSSLQDKASGGQRRGPSSLCKLSLSHRVQSRTPRALRV